MRHISLCGWPLRHHAGVVDHVYGNFSWWHEFSEEHIGVASHNEQAPIWDWLFSGRWQVYDDTPLGAAARIEYFLENGVPDEFTRQHAFDVDVIFAGGCYGRGIIAKYLPRRQALEAEYLTVA